MWGVITAPDVGWRCGGWGTLILKVLSGVCPFQRPHSGSRHGVVLWGGQENPQTHCWGGRGRGMLWGRGTHHGGPQWGFVPSWCPIMAPRVGWCCGAEDTDPGGLQWGRSSAGVPLRLRAVLWGGWMEVTPPHCWGRGGRCDAAPMGLQWGLCPRGGSHHGPRSGVVGNDPGGLQWGFVPSRGGSRCGPQCGAGLWGRWGHPQPHCWGRREAGERSTEGWMALIWGVPNGVLSPRGDPIATPGVGWFYGVGGGTPNPTAGEGKVLGNGGRRGGVSDPGGPQWGLSPRGVPIRRSCGVGLWGGCRPHSESGRGGPREHQMNVHHSHTELTGK